MKSLSAILPLLLAAPLASAVTLSPRGVGQVLLFPYYTVNKHQQTLLSIVNTTAQGKALKIVFREGYNGRQALDFNLFLAPYDLWTATVFAGTDAGLAGTGATITTADGSCAVPDPATQWAGQLPGGAPYQPFLDYAYTGTNADTGPTTPQRTREGYFEVFELGRVQGPTLAAITSTDGVRHCGVVQNPDGSDIVAPGGGLYGAAAVVDVGQGTMFAYAADALDDFRDLPYFSNVDFQPYLQLALNLDGAGAAASAQVALQGRYLRADYPFGERGVDAVSAVLATEQVYVEYDRSAAAGAQSDWVVTFPTKISYVDPQVIGRDKAAIEPFVEAFGKSAPGKSCVQYGLGIYNREARTRPPPGSLPGDHSIDHEPLCTAVQVLTQLSAAELAVSRESRVLGSQLGANILPAFDQGMLALDFNPPGEPHRLRADSSGNRYSGLPAIGFMAINYINANVTPGVLANYSASFPLRGSGAGCTGADGAACP